jgi:WD40 repeat protein
MRTLLGHKESVRCLAYSPDGTHLASGGADRSVKVWDLVSGQSQTVFRGGRQYVHALAFAPDGRLIWGHGAALYLWRSGQTTEEIHTGDMGSVNAVLPTPDGKYVFLSTLDWGGSSGLTPGGLFCRELARPYSPRQDLIEPILASLGEPDRGRYVPRYIRCAALSPDGKTLAIAPAHGGLVCHDWPGGRRWGGGSQGVNVLVMAFSPDSTRLATLAQNTTVTLWRVSPDLEVRRLGKHERQTKCVAFSPDGKLLASSGLDGKVVYWDLATMRERARYDWEVGAVYALAFSPDGMTLAVGGEKGIAICDVDE